MEYIPPLSNYANSNENVDNPICEVKIFNYSAFDAFGYSLGGYDIKRNKTIFKNQITCSKSVHH